jgi:hypothetical protein
MYIHSTEIPLSMKFGAIVPHEEAKVDVADEAWLPGWTLSSEMVLIGSTESSDKMLRRLKPSIVCAKCISNILRAVAMASVSFGKKRFSMRPLYETESVGRRGESSSTFANA